MYRSTSFSFLSLCPHLLTVSCSLFGFQSSIIYRLIILSFFLPFSYLFCFSRFPWIGSSSPTFPIWISLLPMSRTPPPLPLSHSNTPFLIDPFLALWRRLRGDSLLHIPVALNFYAYLRSVFSDPTFALPLFWSERLRRRITTVLHLLVLTNFFTSWGFIVPNFLLFFFL